MSHAATLAFINRRLDDGAESFELLAEFVVMM
jgi:hypothetical protein